MGLLASAQHSLVLGQQHEHQPAWPWALFWCPAPLIPRLPAFQCSSTSLAPSASGGLWRGSATNLSPLSCRCSRFQSEIKRLKISSPVRVCQNCYYSLQHERGAEDGPRNCRDWGSRGGPRNCRDWGSQGDPGLHVHSSSHWESLDHGSEAGDGQALAGSSTGRLPGGSRRVSEPGSRSVAVSTSKLRAPQLSFLHLIFIELFILIWENQQRL